MQKFDELCSEVPLEIGASDESSQNMSLDLNSTGEDLNMSVGSCSYDQSAYIDKLERENLDLKASNKNLKVKLKDANAIIGQLQDQLTTAMDESSLPVTMLTRDKGKYLNPKVILMLMKLLARGISQENAILAVKDVNAVVGFMDQKILAKVLPKRGGTTQKIIHALSYVNATTSHERILEWNEFTAMADETQISGKKILAVNFQNNQTGENLVASCSRITSGHGKIIANKMMKSLEDLRDSGPTDSDEFMQKVCSNMKGIQSDGCSAQISANHEFTAQIKNVVQTTYALVNGVDMTDAQIHEFERSIINVYCGKSNCNFLFHH